MKKIALLSLLIATGSLLGACSNTQSGNKETSLQQKQECQKYLAGIEEQFEQYDEEHSYYRSIKDWKSPSSFLDKVFYSPKENSCLYKWLRYIIVQTEDDQDRIIDEFGLTDALTGENIIYMTAIWGSPNYDAREAEFNEKAVAYE